MDAHLTRLVGSCFGVLRQIRCIRRSLPREALLTLVTSFITSKIDNWNVALAGLPLDRILSVLTAAARLTADAHKFDHVTPLLVNLHWLRVPERNQYKLCVLVHRCLNGAAPQYLSELIQPLSDVESRRRLRSASTAEVLVTATRRSTIGDRVFAVAGPCASNNLPVDLRLSRIFTTFKTHLKSHLFNLSFPLVWLYHWLYHCLFLYRALEAACAAYASLNLSLLHYITLHYIIFAK